MSVIQLGGAARTGGAGLSVAVIQSGASWHDPRATCNRLRPRIEAAVGQGARLIVLPEMFATGFSMAADEVAEPVGGPIATFLREQAEAYGVYLCGSIASRPAGAERAVNRFVLAQPDGSTASYDKIHPFSFAGEDKEYDAGTATITVTIEGCRITPFVCYDLRFADWFWRVAETTDCYVVVANWPVERAAHWRALVLARAIENLAYVVAVNRVGSGGGVDYDGGSLVVGPFGELVHEAGRTDELFLARVDPERVAEVRRSYPFLADR